MNILDKTENQLLPAYIQVARKIHQQLSKMKIGDRLSPERLLCTKLGVSRVTLRRALSYFHEKGILQTHGSGGTLLVKEVTPLPAPQEISNRLVGLVIPSVKIPLISRIVQGAEQCASDRGYHLAVAHDHGDMNYQVKQLRRMLERGVSAIAVYPDSKNIHRKEFISTIREIQRVGIPLVMIDRYIPDIDTPSVVSDNFEGMYAATEHMIMAGYRRIGLLGFGPEGGISNRDRRRGVVEALKEHELDPNPVFESNTGVDESAINAQKAVTDCIAKNRNGLIFDGLVCMHSAMAYGAFIALRDAGLTVPHDIGLVSYDKLEKGIGYALGLNLTSVDQPSEQMGFESVKLLIDELEGLKRQGSARHLLLKPTLIIGTSCNIADEATTKVSR